MKNYQKTIIFGWICLIIAGIIYIGVNSAYSEPKPIAQAYTELPDKPVLVQNEIIEGEPIKEKEAPINEIMAIVSAYNPLPEQTDDTPFINAMGKKVQDGDIANNCLPFETEVEMEGKIYTVRDRMNSRYNDCRYFDIFMWSEEEAINWGRRTMEIKIYQ